MPEDACVALARRTLADFGNQLAWVEADLAAAAQRRASGEIAWIFVAGHRPMYSRLDSDANGQPTGTSGAIQSAFEALFLKYGVDMYVAGHMHSVEVTWPVANNTVTSKSYVDPTAPVYVISGAAGCDEGHSDYSNAPTPGWNRFSDGTNFGLSESRACSPRAPPTHNSSHIDTRAQASWRSTTPRRSPGRSAAPLMAPPSTPSRSCGAERLERRQWR